MSTSLGALVMPGSVSAASHPDLSSHSFLLEIFFPNYVNIALLPPSYRVLFSVYSSFSASIVIALCYTSVSNMLDKPEKYISAVVTGFPWSVVLDNSSCFEDKDGSYSQSTWLLSVGVG